MAMNAGRVVAGGLAAGAVMNVLDFVINGVILKDRMAAEMAKLPGGGEMSTALMVAFVVTDFIVGILLVWLYAAIRPRFGPGVATAMKAGLFVWFFGNLMWSFWAFFGIATWTTFCMGAVLGLVNILLSAYVGGMIYKEEGAPATA